MNLHTSDFSKQNEHFANEIQSRSNASGVCLLLFDSNVISTNVSFVHNLGISKSLQDAYVNRIYHHDPLLPHTSETAANNEIITRVSHKQRPQKETEDGPNATQYWSHLSSVGFIETAASIKALSDSLFLVVGLLSANARTHMNIDPSLNSIEQWLNQSSNYMISSAVRQHYVSNAKPVDTSLPDIECLTKREADVVKQLLQGQSNKQISSELELSEYTVENHLRRIYKKFDVHNRTSLLARVHAASEG
ncbi:response regulator transcription factor [Haliea atlantica]